MLTDPGCVIVADELVEDEFTASACIEDAVSLRLERGRLPSPVMGDPDTAATGAVMRPATLRRYASGRLPRLEILPVDAGMLRFYR